MLPASYTVQRSSRSRSSRACTLETMPSPSSTRSFPALRERPEDLSSLIAMELQTAVAAARRRITSIHPAAMEMLLSYPWPGNLRELHHTMRSVVLFCEGAVVMPEHVNFHGDAALPTDGKTLDGTVPPEPDGDPSLTAAVTRHVHRVYEQTGRSQRQAARLLGISRGKLARHLGKS